MAQFTNKLAWQNRDRCGDAESERQTQQYTNPLNQQILIMTMVEVNEDHSIPLSLLPQH